MHVQELAKDADGYTPLMEDEYRKHLWSKVEQLEKHLDRLVSWMGSEFGYGNQTRGNVYRHLDEIKGDIQKVDKVLEGNGKPGHKTRMVVLEEKMASIFKFVWVIIVAVVGLVVAEAFSFIGR